MGRFYLTYKWNTCINSFDFITRNKKWRTTGFDENHALFNYNNKNNTNNNNLVVYIFKVLDIIFCLYMRNE